jgi:NUMOD3 motif
MNDSSNNSDEKKCEYCGTDKTYIAVTKNGTPYPKWNNNPFKEDSKICGKCYKNLSYHKALPPLHIRRGMRIARIAKRVCYKCGGKTSTQKSKSTSYDYQNWHRHPIIPGKWLCAKCHINRLNETKKKFKTKVERYKYLSGLFTGTGNPFFSKQHSIETKKLISSKKVGRSLPEHVRLRMIGRPIEADTREKISLRTKGRPSPMKGRHHSNESKLRIAISNTGRMVSVETRKKQSQAKKGKRNPMYGKNISQEIRDKISESTKGQNNHFFGKQHTDSTKRIISEKNKGRPAWNKGLKTPDETKKKLSVSHIGIYPSKEILIKRSKSLTGLKRKPISEDTRIKMSRSHLGKKLSEETRMKMRKCQLNERTFSTPLSSEAKYWIGVLLADGNVSIKKGIPIVAFHLHEIDKDHISKFRSFVKSTHKIGHYVNKKTGRVYCSISFSCKIMADDIAKYGIVPKKWFILKVKGGIENDRDLWRGIIDGDGTLGVYPRKTANGTIRSIPYISLTGNLYICHQFKAFLEHQLGLPIPGIIPYKNSYLFSVSDHRAVRAIKLLYENCTVALDRKLEVARRIMDSFLVQGNSRYLTRL